MAHDTQSPLAAWLSEECRARDLSWAEASRRAGVDKGAISLIVRGRQPGLATCEALAAFFGVPPEYVLRLAGRLGGEPEPPQLAPAVRDMVRELEQLPPPLQARLLAAWQAMLEAMQASASPDA